MVLRSLGGTNFAKWKYDLMLLLAMDRDHSFREDKLEFIHFFSKFLLSNKLFFSIMCRLSSGILIKNLFQILFLLQNKSRCYFDWARLLRWVADKRAWSQ
jgi:hypothetical protein